MRVIASEEAAAFIRDNGGTLWVWIDPHTWLGGTVYTYLESSTERPGTSLDNPIDVPRDLAGLSIKNPRIRVIHTTDPHLEGGSMYLQEVDPWLGYMWGKSLTQRNFR